MGRMIPTPETTATLGLRSASRLCPPLLSSHSILRAVPQEGHSRALPWDQGKSKHR